VLFTVQPGELLAAERGERDWPHNVFRTYWPLACVDSFQPAAAPVAKSVAPAAALPVAETA
jgi:hypothetical protein